MMRSSLESGGAYERGFPASETLRIVCLSDTHELHREVDVPDGDILLHAGDFTMFSRSLKAIGDFDRWLGELPHRCIITAGNHESFLEKDASMRRFLSNARLLINEPIEVRGLRIWASPVTPWYGGAFGLSSAADREKLYARVPPDVDVLVTHGPPFGILDVAPESNDHAGDMELVKLVNRIRPKVHLFGHIHGAYGTCELNGTLFVNAALLGPGGGIEHDPIVIRLHATD